MPAARRILGRAGRGADGGCDERARDGILAQGDRVEGARPMADYYSILLRAVTAPEAGDRQWRRGVFDRARQMLASQLRTRQPPMPEPAIAAELEAMDLAIERIEAELAWTERGGGAPDAPARQPPRRRDPAMRLGGVPMIAALVLLPAGGAAALVLWAE